jgi:hypothetical protein
MVQRREIMLEWCRGANQRVPGVPTNAASARWFPKFGGPSPEKICRQGTNCPGTYCPGVSSPRYAPANGSSVSPGAGASLCLPELRRCMRWKHSMFNPSGAAMTTCVRCTGYGWPRGNFRSSPASSRFRRRTAMDFGKGALLWLLGVPLPIILLLALFWHH